MREYELTIIIQPEISEEGSATILGRLDGLLKTNSSIRLLCDDLGKRKLAFEIDRFQKGHYYLLSFLDSGKAVPELERVLRLEESVLRFLTVKANDEVVDIDARVAEAKQREEELAKRAAEKAARAADDAKAREEAEALAAERAAAAAAEASVKSEASADGKADSEASSEDSPSEEAASAEDTAAPAAAKVADADASDEKAPASETDADANASEEEKS